MKTLSWTPNRTPAATPTGPYTDTANLLNALPHPVFAVLPDGRMAEANAAAETFFGVSRNILRRQKLVDLVAPGSPLIGLVELVNARGAAINEYRVDLALSKMEGDRIVDIFVTPLPDAEDGVVITLQERSLTDKMDRQLTSRGGAKSAAAMASMLAHEIKNPLSGIRGAAQLLEAEASDSDRALTQLICEETDRIVKLVDRMSAFYDGQPIERESVNIHAVLDHVKKVSEVGFARHIRFHENYDPSLPLVHGNKDQLTQIFLNLVKNAAEAIGENRTDGDIELTTAFRPGVRMPVPGSKSPVSLPLEFCVRDNGCGVADEVLPYLFDPFVTTKPNGTGLGLALVAKIIGDHGGAIECESVARRTTFRVLMPVYNSRKALVES
ncbi:two-component system sensor histidine kinase NtrB [Methylocapsa palsarum]|uniref:histidine kinase n=1 Tax=Methylocapsa palsarum TaxID=1612308 RepID=A0A1I3Y970_9HYPH|nr:ATP-binding protein [Methylocapsa palsarum]SFK28270.1 two-component system, NtrC family, nitrogen regulation sensor histidine kinase GlnL [Methylocapsa palsarum]